MIKEIMPLDQVLHTRASMSPRATFVKFEGKKFSYKEMDRLATVFASELIKRGMKPGDPIALLCHNCPHYIAAYFGIIRGGGIVLPLNNLLAAEEIDFILDDAAALICLYDADCADSAQKLTRSTTRSFFTSMNLRMHTSGRILSQRRRIRLRIFRPSSIRQAPQDGPRAPS